MGVAERRSQEQNMRRNLILDAAAGKLFQEKGYETTTIDEIAALAELGKGTIYSYFKSKEEVYIASFENSLDELENTIHSAIATSDFAAERLNKLLEAFIAYYNKNKGFMDTLLVQTDEQFLIRLGYLGERLQYRFTKWLEFIGGILQQGMTRDEFVRMDVEKVSKIIFGIIFGVMIEKKMGLINEELADFKASAFWLVLMGICKRPL